MSPKRQGFDTMAKTLAEGYCQKLLASGMAYEFAPQTIGYSAFREGFFEGVKEAKRLAKEAEEAKS